MILAPMQRFLINLRYFLQCEEGSNANRNTTLPLVIDNPRRKQSLWIPPKSNSNAMKDLYPWLKRTFFMTLVEKESHRIYRKMKRKRWKIRGRGLWYWFLLGSPDIALGFFISKIITAIQISDKKRNFKWLWWVAPQKTENGTFLDNW